MKAIFFPFYMVLIPLFTSAQPSDVKSELTSAQQAYQSGELNLARSALLESLQKLNGIIAVEIQNLLPEELGGIPILTSEELTGQTSLSGIMVNRNYGKEENSKKIEVTITDHSPLIAMVNTFLNNPMLSGLSTMTQSDQKTVKVNGFKGMLEKTVDEDEVIIYMINVPFGDSLLTVETTGIDSEEKALALAKEIPIVEIEKLVR